MSLQPRRPLLDSLRDTLCRMDAHPDTEAPNLADLKRIIRQRISEIEASQLITSR
jgi:hypothetical protein